MNFGPIKNGSVPNFLLFMPTDLNMVANMSTNMEYLLRVETNLKLNLINKETNKRLLTETSQLLEPEVHFLRIEGIMKSINIGNPLAIFELRDTIGISSDKKVDDW